MAWAAPAGGPPEALTLGAEDRELFLIHESIDDGNEAAAIDHLQRAAAGHSGVVPLLRAWRRVLNGECGTGAEGRYSELAGRMAELESHHAHGSPLG